MYGEGWGRYHQLMVSNLNCVFSMPNEISYVISDRWLLIPVFYLKRMCFIIYIHHAKLLFKMIIYGTRPYRFSWFIFNKNTFFCAKKCETTILILFCFRRAILYEQMNLQRIEVLARCLWAICVILVVEWLWREWLDDWRTALEGKGAPMKDR